MNELAGAVEKSKPTLSAKSAGQSMNREAQQEELLAILSDHLQKISEAGIGVTIVPEITRNGVQCIGFLVEGVCLADKRIRVLPALPEK